MTSITKKFAAALAAVGVMAGSLFAQSPFLVTDFDGSVVDQNNLGFYYYYAYTEQVDGMRNEVFAFPSGRNTAITPPEITGNPGIREDFPVVFAPFEGLGVGGTRAGGFELQNLPAEGPTTSSVLALDQPTAYPGWQFGIMLTGDDNIGFDAQHRGRTSGFATVDSIVFTAKLEGVDEGAPVMFGFAVETTKNAPGATPQYGPFDDPWYGAPELGRPTNFNVYRVLLRPDGEYGTAGPPAGVNKTDLGGGFIRYAISLKPYTPPTGDLTIKCAGPDPDCPGTGRVGALTQEAWHGMLYDFDPAEATKIKWFFRTQDNPGAQEAGARLIIDDVQFIGPNFTFVRHGVCPNCLELADQRATNTLTMISDFDNITWLPTVTWEDEEPWGTSKDDPESDVEDYWSPTQNMLGYYWYWYGSNEDDIIITSGVDNTNTIQVSAAGGVGGSAGLSIAYDLAGAEPCGEVGVFVGMGTNFFDAEPDDANPLRNRPTHYDASIHNGLYFLFKAPATVPELVVEFTDAIDIEREAGMTGDQCGSGDGIRFHAVIENKNPGEWTRVGISFGELVQPAWLTPSHASAAAIRSHIDASRLMQIQFRYDGTTNGEFAIDSVAFFTGTVNVRHAVNGRRAAGAGLRASFNRGVVNVNWNAPSNVESGRIQLVDARGRIVSTAPLTRVSDRRVTANLGAQARIPAGRYFVRVDARDANGRRIVQQAPVTIMR